MTKLSVLDVFAGGGGFSEGFRLAGYEVQTCLEVDQWAADTLRHNFPNANILQGDIRDFNTHSGIKQSVSRRPDVIIGGPPCQGFSVAGPAKDPKDPRNTLFKNFADWVEALRPSVFVMENVQGLLNRKNAQGENVIDIIRARFKSIGYEVKVWKLNAAHFGVPQLRHRIFIVGSLHQEISQPSPQYLLPEETRGPGLHDLKPAVTVWDALSDLPKFGAGGGSEEMDYTLDPLTEYQQWARTDSKKVLNHAAMLHTKRLVERFRQIQAGGSIESMADEFRVLKRNGNGILSEAQYNSNYRHLKKEMISYTIPASFYSTFIHSTEPRNLTAREAARLQSFPDTYCFKGKRTQISSKLLTKRGKESEDYLSQYNQVGNAVPPLLAKAIADHIHAHISSTVGQVCELPAQRIKSILPFSTIIPQTANSLIAVHA